MILQFEYPIEYPICSLVHPLQVSGEVVFHSEFDQSIFCLSCLPLFYLLLPLLFAFYFHPHLVVHSSLLPPLHPWLNNDAVFLFFVFPSLDVASHPSSKYLCVCVCVFVE